MALNFPTVEDTHKDAEFEYQRLLSMACQTTYLSAPSAESDHPLLPSVFLSEREEDAKVTDTTVYCKERWQILNPTERPSLTKGVIYQNPDTIQIIRNRFDETYPFSVTLLEVYLNCPYRFYLASVLGLEALEEPSLEPEGRLLGTVLHDTLERLFTEGADMKHIDDQLIALLHRGLAERRLNPFLRLWINDWVKARVDWFADLERTRAEEGWRVDAEWLERRLKYSFGGFTVKGRVDRVDWKDGEASVLDYKSGRLGNFKRNIEKGVSIQLPLYAEMIRALHKARIASIGIYGFAHRKLDEIEYPDQAIKTAVQFASRAVSGIREGSFAAGKTGFCRYCEFKEFC
ncbi:hypothetical protein GF359_07815 [candidate division WOR-3 bacterium]|uniref:PD-(D/E)XK endonuclease-like domain-containing protein n=1 Tax=candidate division WOR-3 bacterium TaxID=2052148 RepID=A0A9D5K9V8_UNCW3|nr:hypothetical protein [candidate division WOR-3 bacterium]MBD3365107.1 hypothetical protein [candidate division WOR-3 bacterium]